MSDATSAEINLASVTPGGLAVVAGATGAIGQALYVQLGDSEAFAEVLALSRSGETPFDLTSEASTEAVAKRVSADGRPLRVFIDATGYLHGGGFAPEKSWRQLDPAHMAQAFAVNAIGPALLIKHFLPLLPREGKSVFATLSAKVGSIGDNQLGGWYSYRASKAALNQIVRTAAIELKRRKPDAVCVALHPGTVESSLSAPFGKSGLTVRSPETAAADLLDVVNELSSDDSGGFFDYAGKLLPW